MDEADAAFGRRAAARDQQPRRFVVEVRVAETGRHRALEVGEEPRRRRNGLALVVERRDQLPGRVLGRRRQRPGALQQDHAADPVGKDRRHQRCDAGAHGVPDQREARPAEGVRSGGDLGHPVDEVVHRRGRSVLGAAVARQVEGHQLELGQQRPQALEARRVVEPAMHGERRLTVLGPPRAGREPEVRQLDLQLAAAHRWSRYIRSANSPAGVARKSSTRASIAGGSTSRGGSGEP